MEGNSEMMPMEGRYWLSPHPRHIELIYYCLPGSPGSGDYYAEDMSGDHHYVDGQMVDMDMDEYDPEMMSGHGVSYNS